jgi:flagellar motor switch protein FliN/FliY
VPTLDKVTVDLMVVLGTTSMPIHQVMRLSRGAIIELDATEADEVKILANNLPIASGVVLVDRNRIAVEVKQMLPRLPGAPANPDSSARRPCPPIIDLLHPAPLIRSGSKPVPIPKSARGGIGRRAALRWQ